MLRLQHVLEDFQIATTDSLQHAWSPCCLSPFPLCKCLLELKTSCLSWTQLSNFITKWTQLSDFITLSQAGCRLFWHCNNCVVSRLLSFSCCQSASLAPDWKLNHFPGWSAAHARGPGSSGAVIGAGERLKAPQLCVMCLDLAQTRQAYACKRSNWKLQADLHTRSASGLFSEDFHRLSAWLSRYWLSSKLCPIRGRTTKLVKYLL